MSNPSRDKGTKWESAVVRWLHANGYPDAKRNTLGGNLDPGDIEPIPGTMPPVIVSAKNGYGGKPCLSCNHVREIHAQTAMFEKWWKDLNATVSRRNPDKALALLCLHRAGKASPEFSHWYADYRQINFGRHTRMPFTGPVKITGSQALLLMKSWCVRQSQEYR